MVNYSCGLIGWPLNYSLSPTLHRAAFVACNLDGAYSLYPIAPFPDGQIPLAELFQRMRTGDINGLNVTVPHKLNVMALLDDLTPTARAVGAVNTVLCNGGNLIGENTDVSGFLDDIKQYIQLGDGGRALVLGAGGGARAVVYALAEQGWEVFIVSRRAEQAAQLAADFMQLKTKPIHLSCELTNLDMATENLNIQLMVNTTPLGMQPHEQLSPWPVEVRLPADCFVYDLIYEPAETNLLRMAKEQGLKHSNGLGMLINQAARSFVLWTKMPDEKLPFIHSAILNANITRRGAS